MAETLTIPSTHAPAPSAQPPRQASAQAGAPGSGDSATGAQEFPAQLSQAQAAVTDRAQHTNASPPHRDPDAEPEGEAAAIDETVPFEELTPARLGELFAELEPVQGGDVAPGPEDDSAAALPELAESTSSTETPLPAEAGPPLTARPEGDAPPVTPASGPEPAPGASPDGLQAGALSAGELPEPRAQAVSGRPEESPAADRPANTPEQTQASSPADHRGRGISPADPHEARPQNPMPQPDDPAAAGRAGTGPDHGSESGDRGDNTLEAALRRFQPPEAAESPPAQRLEAMAQAEAAARPGSPRAEEGRILPEIPARNEAEIIRQARMLIEDRGGRVQIQLHPPQLGELGVRLQVSEQSVQLNFVADRLPLAELLSRHLPELRQALEAQGLQLDRVNVDVRDRGDAEGGFRSSDRAFEREGWSGPRQRPSGELGPFSLANGRLTRGIQMTSLGTVDLHV